jgi:hypothetical protein
VGNNLIYFDFNLNTKKGISLDKVKIKYSIISTHTHGFDKVIFTATTTNKMRMK